MRPTLLVLAAGLGSRYGGLKQLDAVGPAGETILDFSVYDALRAGFGKVVFVIRRDFEDRFRELVVARFAHRVDVSLAFQELDALLPSALVTADRDKPWGTGHAVLVAESELEGPFAVVNADDFYGRRSYELMGDLLRTWGRAGGAGARARGEGAKAGAGGESVRARAEGGPAPESFGADSRSICAMVGFELRDTLSAHGAVNRGICEIDESGALVRIVETTGIVPDGDDARVVRQAGGVRPSGDEARLAGDTLTSMNFWGLTPAIFEHLRASFDAFLAAHAEEPAAEFGLPVVVDELVQRGDIRVEVLRGGGPWFGVTYGEDRDHVAAAIDELIEGGAYPEPLWS